MIIYPAIDLKDGKCVRLTKGDFNQETIYSRSPLEQAKVFEQKGEHTRAAISANSLPLGVAVEIDAIFELI